MDDHDGPVIISLANKARTRCLGLSICIFYNLSSKNKLNEYSHILKNVGMYLGILDIDYK